MSLLAILMSYSLAFPPQPDITIEITENPKIQSNLVFISPHENESVANDYLKAKIESEGGKFIQLRQQGHRLIQLKIDSQKILIDPNRIFTKRGRLSTLKKLNPKLKRPGSILNKAKKKTKLLSEFLLKQLNTTTLSKDSRLSWVAMHNNTNGFDGDGNYGEGTISIIRYKNKLKSGSKFLIEVNVTENDEDDLFYVTQKVDFDKMKLAGWNAVLEHPNVKTDINEDDGSLSVFANKSDIRYINIEAERKSQQGGEDHIKEKQQMIDYVYSLSTQ